MGIVFNKDYCELNKMRNIGDIGIVTVKPFAYLVSSPFRDEMWEMRLLNASELLEIYNKYPSIVGSDRLTDEAHQGQKIEMFIRSVVTRNGRALVTAQDVEMYNKAFSLEETPNAITQMELSRAAAGELEQYILNTWWTEYQLLMGKQRNLIYGVVVCQRCSKELPIKTPGLPPITNIDEVAYCPSCPKVDSTNLNTASTIETLAADINIGSEKDAQ